MPIQRLKDRAWIRQSFMLSPGKIDEVDMRRRLLTTASFKFTDTTLGGNFAINAPPSYSRFVDPRMGGRTEGGSGIAFMRGTGRFQMRHNDQESIEDEIEDQMISMSSGMGAYYSEAIDDNGQMVTMRFGTPAFNSLSTFFGQFYSAKAAQFSRTGRADQSPTGVLRNIFVGAFEAAGSAVGTMLALPFQPLIYVGAFVRFLSGSPPSKYYYLKPNMFPYWAAVQNIVNAIGVNLGVVPQQLTKGQQDIYGPSDGEFGPGDYQAYSRKLPDIISPSGFIDVFAMATKAQRRANRYNTRLMNKMEGNITSMGDLRRAIVETRREFSNESPSEKARFEQHDFAYYLNQFTSVEAFQAKADASEALSANSTEPTADENAPGADALEPIGDRSQFNQGESLWNFMHGELRDGANFVTFRVDYSGSTSESFTNEVGESGIAQKINSMSASARAARFDVADGNIVPGIGAMVDAAKGFVNNALDSIQMSGLAALAGSAFVDIPHVWQNAVAQMPSATFTMELRSPYGNRLSQMQNLYIPLAMILAGGLPHMTGKRSYSQPFLCELYCKGRVNIRMGIIDSISIERGVGNTGWNQEGHALGINVTFSVKDLSTIMAMPLTTQFSAASRLVGLAGEAIGGDAGRDAAGMLTKSMFDDDNAFTDYMAALGGLGFQDLVYAGRRWRLNRIRYQRSVEEMKSPARWASFMVNSTMPGRIANALALDTDRP